MSSIANFLGVIGPLITGFILDSYETKAEGYQIVFL